MEGDPNMNQTIIHELKVDPRYFKELESGSKTFEIRKDDRPFQVSDVLLLKSFDNENAEYTGATIFAYVLGVFGREIHEKEYVRDGYVILSIEILRNGYTYK